MMTVNLSPGHVVDEKAMSMMRPILKEILERIISRPNGMPD